jgi:hypothetical protein
LKFRHRKVRRRCWSSHRQEKDSTSDCEMLIEGASVRT